MEDEKVYRTRDTYFGPDGTEVISGVADAVFVVVKWAFLLVFLPARFLIRKLTR